MNLPNRWPQTIVYSLITAAMGLLAIYVLAKFLWMSELSSIDLNNLIRWVSRYIGYPDVYWLVGAVLLLLSFVYFNHRAQQVRHQQYLAHIIAGAGEMASGMPRRRLPVHAVGSLGQLADAVNRVIERMETLAREEKQAELTKNELITNVSHDLRTPLTSVLGYLSLIEQDRYRDEVELRYYTSAAYEEAMRLHRLVEDLFEYTRLRNQELRIHPVKIDAAELLRQMMPQFTLPLREANVELRLFARDVRLPVNADSDKLRRVFDNVIMNGIKYGSSGRYVDVACSVERGWAEIVVANYGEPIPQADLPLIFDRFYRVERSRSLHTGGSGLGLAIAKQIMELHGGTIHAESDSHQTQFVIRLPLAEPVRRDGTEHQASAQSGSFS
ncbi:HAMP domain-containing sensor histidine kinase [Paenibacillus filicis]|uniref:histidine kinase n=1 Tax=Paenibacillus filicis TaxID=669464 RepID=A0ABU9DMN0_9BACL